MEKYPVNPGPAIHKFVDKELEADRNIKVCPSCGEDAPIGQTCARCQAEVMSFLDHANGEW